MDDRKVIESAGSRRDRQRPQPLRCGRQPGPIRRLRSLDAESFELRHRRTARISCQGCDEEHELPVRPGRVTLPCGSLAEVWQDDGAADPEGWQWLRKGGTPVHEWPKVRVHWARGTDG